MVKKIINQLDLTIKRIPNYTDFFQVHIYNILQARPCVCVCVSHSVMSNSATPWTVAYQAPLSMEYSMKEYCTGLHFLLQGSPRLKD